MKITYGKEGLTNSWQADFPEEVDCVHCDGKARSAINIKEESGEDQYITDLHPNLGGSGGDFWLHDAAAFQIYLCRKCLKPTALYNQG